MINTRLNTRLNTRMNLVHPGSKLNLPLLVRNEDIVEAAGYSNIITGTGNVNVVNRYILNKNNLTRIRQSGRIKKLKFYNNGNPWILCKIQVWRKDGITYDLVAEQDVTSQTSAFQINDIILDLEANEGDYVGIGGYQSSGDSLVAKNGYLENSTRYTTNEIPAVIDFAWDSKSALADYIIPIKCYIKSPLIVGIGGSIIAGHPTHYSFIENSFTTSLDNQVLAQLAAIDSNYIYQNMGIGSQTTTQIAARFAADVVDLKPKIALINGGVNDIAGGIITKSTFLSNYTSMLDACVAASIVPVVCKIIPWTNGTNTQMQTRDEWMADLKALVQTYSGSVWVDFDVDMGQFRTGGDVNNLWDLQTAYNQDGVHPNLAGYTKMAEIIDREIKKKYRFV